jgi:hypothetical protein
MWVQIWGECGRSGHKWTQVFTEGYAKMHESYDRRNLGNTSRMPKRRDAASQSNIAGPSKFAMMRFKTLSSLEDLKGTFHAIL